MFLKQLDFRQTSVWALILSNVLLFCLAVYYELSLLDILLMFWGETVVIAFFNFFKMLLTNRMPKIDKNALKSEKINEEMLVNAGKFMLGIFKYFLIIWSSILLAGFCFMSLALIVILFGDESIRNSREFPAQELSSFLLGTCITFVSHGVSFFTNFIRKKEYERLKLRSLIFAPFRRILLVWLAAIAGALILLALKNNSVYLLIPYFLGRLFFDLRQHYKEHTRLEQSLTN